VTANPIHVLLADAGFHPVGRGAPTYHCPVCGTGPRQYQHGDARGPLRVFNGRRGPAWKCHACEAGGGIYALARALDCVDRVALAEQRRAEAPPPAVAGRIDVRRAWHELQLDRAAWQASCGVSLASWAPVDLANRLASSAVGIAWADVNAVSGRTAKSLARWAAGHDRRLMVALHDVAGEVRSAVARYHAAVPVDGPRFLFLSSARASVADGETLTYGSIPAAVAAGGPICLVEGARDWIVAQAWASRHGGAAVGARSHGELPTVARLLADEVERQSRPVSGVELRLVPHLGDHDDVGERSMAGAADLLRDRAAGTVRMMRCHLGANGKADLADQLAGCATAADAWAKIDRLLADAVLVADAPLDVRDPGASDLLRLRIASVAKSAAEHPDRLYVVETPEGVGKTRASMRVLADHVAAGGVGVLYQTTHERLRESRAELDRLVEAGDAPAVEVHHMRGRAALCEQAAGLDRAGEPDAARDLRARLSSDRNNRICMGCPLRQTCPAMRAQGIKAGELTQATHERMRRGLSVPHTRVDALQVIDEAADLVTHHEVKSADLGGVLTADSPAMRAWRADNVDAVEAIRRILGCLDEVALRRRGAFAAHVPASAWFADLLDLGAAGPARVLFVPRQTSLFQSDTVDLCQVATPPDAPSWAIRHGSWRGRYVDRDAWNILVEVARGLTRGCPPESGRWLQVGPDGSWSLVAMRAARIPDGPAMVLDATAVENGPRLDALARASGRTVERVSIPARVLAPGRAVHVRTNGFARSRVLVGGRPAPHAFGLLRRILLTMGESMPSGGSVGIITLKGLADALLDPSSELGELRAWARDFLRLDLVVGWYGRDETGTNRFSGCDALLLLGDPTGNMSAAAAEARTAGVDPMTYWSGMTRARARQACARGRSARRGAELRVLMYVGRTAPTVPGVSWEVSDLDRGRMMSDDKVEAVRFVRTLAASHGALAAPALRPLPALDGIADQRVREICGEVARTLGWTQHHVKAGPARWAVYAPDRESAERFAAFASSQNGLGVESAGIADTVEARGFAPAAPADAPSRSASSAVGGSSMGNSGGPAPMLGLRRHGPPLAPPAVRPSSLPTWASSWARPDTTTQEAV
jgi:hypothetical protein